MIAWIRENAPLFSLGAALILCISTVAVDRYRISGLFATQVEVRQHMADSARHLDPQRDAEATKELKERLERLERQIERLERRQLWIINNVRRPHP
jgi:hypothetical protein